MKIRVSPRKHAVSPIFVRKTFHAGSPHFIDRHIEVLAGDSEGVMVECAARGIGRDVLLHFCQDEMAVAALHEVHQWIGMHKLAPEQVPIKL